MNMKTKKKGLVISDKVWLLLSLLAALARKKECKFHITTPKERKGLRRAAARTRQGTSPLDPIYASRLF